MRPSWRSWLRRRGSCCLLALPAALIAQEPAAKETPLADDALVEEEIEVVDVVPLLGAGLDASRIPSRTPLVTGGELEALGAASLAGALGERFGLVAVEEATTNPFQQTLRIRGFTASPILGLPQGVAAFQNGVRINEPFGDTVQFDLVPQFALQRVQLSLGSDPTFGLNALGGGLALRLKDGFTARGSSAELLGGSFGRFSGTVQTAHAGDRWALYAGAMHWSEDGWRDASDSEVGQGVVDLAFRGAGTDGGVSLVVADTQLNGNGTAPIELLAVDREAVFTFPDTTDNELALLQGRLRSELSEAWALQAAAYYRDADRFTVNGDESDFVECSATDLPAGAPNGTFCSDDGALIDIASGRLLTVGDGEGDGAFNRTRTKTEGYGATVQVTSTADLAELRSHFVLGASLDLADIEFGVTNELGSLTAKRTVDGSGFLVGVFGEAPDDEFNTGLEVDTESYGVYASETLSVSERLHLTLSGRYDRTEVDIRDLLGASLTGSHRFSRFNPSLGGVFDLGDETQVFARYGEASRAPTGGGAQLRRSGGAVPGAERLRLRSAARAGGGGDARGRRARTAASRLRVARLVGERLHERHRGRHSVRRLPRARRAGLLPERRGHAPRRGRSRAGRRGRALRRILELRLHGGDLRVGASVAER